MRERGVLSINYRGCKSTSSIEKSAVRHFCFTEITTVWINDTKISNGHIESRCDYLHFPATTDNYFTLKLETIYDTKTV